MHVASDEKNGGLLYVGFNQDCKCFGCGTEKGFIIFNCDPLKERFRREFLDGGIGIVEMLFRCNIIALVGGGATPWQPKNKVMIWDDYQNKAIAELEFRQEVKAVRLTKDRIVVVLESKVFVYNFADLQLLDQIETVYNPKGLCALCPREHAPVLACPGRKLGYVHVELYHIKQSVEVAAHNTALCQIALNLEGTLLATASEQGTLIRVFDTTDNGRKLHEFRRGVNKAEIYSIAFNASSTFLCVSSDKGTIHIYALLPQEASPTEQLGLDSKSGNRQSSLVMFKNYLPSYFSSEWSLAQFWVPDSQCICAFGADGNSVIAVCANGSFFKLSFDPEKGGEAKQEGYARFLRDASEEI